MANAFSSHARSAPASVCLLAEHLDAVLAAGEDLVGIRYVWSGAPPRQRDAIMALRAGQRATIERIRLVELALLSRLIKAREWASVVAREREGLGLIARLYVRGTADPRRRHRRVRRHHRHRLRHRRRPHRLCAGPRPHHRGCAGALRQRADLRR